MGWLGEHEVSVEWREPGSWVTYEVDGDTGGTWTGPRIRLRAIDAWWARGDGPPDAGRMPGLVGGPVTVHVDGVRQVYVLREWHPGPEWPGRPYDGYFDAKWPD